MKNNKLILHVGKVSCGIIISRFLGYTRDILIATTFGTTVYTDAFYIAIKIPNLVRCLFGENSFAISIIPVFSEYLNNYKKQETQRFLNVVFTLLLIILILISIFGIIIAPILIKLIAIGFQHNSTKILLTIEITRLILPSIIFIGLSAFLLSVLNVLNSFFIPSVAPAISNLLEILYLVMTSYIIVCVDSIKIKGLAISFVIGALFYFIVQYLGLKYLGWKLKLNFHFKEPGLKKVILLMCPSILGVFVEQINVFIDSNCASYLAQGSITALYYSSRIMQLPLAMIGIAFASVLFPIMSKAYLQNDLQTFKQALNYAIRMTNFILLPASIGLMFIGLPLVKALFEYGNFHGTASIMTNKALFYYALGLPAFAVTKLLNNAFYSSKNTQIPVKMAILSMILHALLCFILIKFIDIRGLALATSFAAYFNCVCLMIYLKSQIGRFGLNKICLAAIKSLCASLVSGIIAKLVMKRLYLTIRLIPLSLITIITSCIIFILISYFINNEELNEIIQHLPINMVKIKRR
jgi:putative peptidoglycan lipid II flippase